MGGRNVPRHSRARPPGGQSPHADHRAFSLWPQLFPEGAAGGCPPAKGCRVLSEPGPQALAQARQPPVARPPRTGLKRFNALNALNDSTPGDIMKSIKERSVSNEELGMSWRETESSWWWYRAPIETQALMIEAFDEVMGDKQAVQECKVWLLKQKQTQDWKTTKATADAVYGLLLRGRDLLASDKLVEVTVGGISVFPSPSPQRSPPARGSSSSPRTGKPNASPASSPANVSPSPRGEGRGAGKGRDDT